MTPTSDGKHEGFNVTTEKISKSSETSSAKSLLNRSNSFSRFLGRAESKRSQRNNNNTNQSNVSVSNLQQSQQQTADLYLSSNPSSPRTLQKRNSLEGGIMSMEKVKQTCVKVFGEDGQTRIVNVHTASEAKAIMAKVLHKFGIDEANADSYCIFVGSSTNGEARALSDQELIDICRSTDRPEKERLILRKRHLYPTHEEFKRKGTINNARRQYQKDEKPSSPLYNGGWSVKSSTSLNRPDYLSNRNSHAGSIRSQNTTVLSSSNSTRGRRRFFGERPPSEIISSNLQSFFPNHNREILETAGIKAQRLSMTRRNSSLCKMEPRNYRNSVLPELVSVLGVDLDRFLEEEEDNDEDYDSLLSSSSSSSSSGSSSGSESDEEKVIEEENKVSTDDTPTTHVDLVLPVDPPTTHTTTHNLEMVVPTLNQRRSSSLFYRNEYKSFKPTVEDSKYPLVCL